MSEKTNTGGFVSAPPLQLVGETACGFPFMTVEQWAEKRSTAPRLFAAARARHRWPVGKLLTEEAYDAAIDQAATVTLR